MHDAPSQLEINRRGNPALNRPTPSFRLRNAQSGRAAARKADPSGTGVSSAGRRLRQLRGGVLRLQESQATAGKDLLKVVPKPCRIR